MSYAMSDDLRLLIARFNEAQRHAIAALREWGVPIPRSTTEWVGIRMDIANRKYPKAGRKNMYPHGDGLSFKDATVAIDFDFGEHGEIDCFDPKRLFRFAEANKMATKYTTWLEVRDEVEAAVAAGVVRCSGQINYSLNREV